MKSTSSVRTLQRWWQVQSIFLRYGFDILIEQDEVQKARQRFSKEKPIGTADPIAQLSTPEKVRLMLQDLGPTFVKLGQMAASQSASLPPAWIEELKKLQSDVPPFPAEQVQEMLQTELGAPLEEFFAAFELEPLAAASIGQVHRAVLPGGLSVVVKVQRPGIVPQIESDIAIMREVAALLHRTTGWAKNYGVVDIVDEFAYNLQSELDYRNEARNADRLRQNMAQIEGVHIPTMHWELMTTRIMTMEQIEGVKITNLKAIDHAGLDRLKLVDTFMKSMIHQLLIDGFFHADPHPGNIFVNLKSGQIIFLDMGMMGYLVEEQRASIIGLLQALNKSDSREIVRIALEMGILYQPVDERLLRRDVDRLLNRYMTASLSEIPVAEVISRILVLVFERGIRLPSDLTLALKSLLQTEEIARTLNPDIQIADVASMLSRHIMLERLKPAALMERASAALAELIRVAPLFQSAFEQILRQLQSGKLTVQLDAENIPYQLRDIAQIFNRFTLGLTLAGMTIGSALTMSVSPDQTWSFIPLLGTIGFIVSMTGASLLVFGVMWDMWKKR